MKTILVDLGQFNSKYLQDVCFSWHNHGLGMIATTSKDVDFTGLKYLNSWQEFKDKIIGYDIAGISMMSSDYLQAMIAVDIIKEVNPECKIIIGGIGVTVNPKVLLVNKKIDYILTGEGEVTFPEFLKDASKFDREIKGEIPNLDDLPFLDRSIYPEPLERNVDGWGESPMATILTARGCPFNCSFCQPAERNHFGSKVRRRSVRNVVAEIRDLINKYDPKFFVFYDDSFCYDIKWLNEFIKQYKFNIPFLASARVDFICENPAMVYKLKKVGMKVISIGFKSGSQRILDMVGKGTTVSQNYKAAEITGNAGIKIFANIMYGFPTETKEEQFSTYRLCKYISTYESMISPAYFTPFPGSRLGDECISKGLSLINENNCTRFGRDKIVGVDYDFLDSFIWRN